MWLCRYAAWLRATLQAMAQKKTPPSASRMGLNGARPHQLEEMTQHASVRGECSVHGGVVSRGQELTRAIDSSRSRKGSGVALRIAVLFFPPTIATTPMRLAFS